MPESRAIEDMTPREAYDVGYRNGESSLLADVNTLCEQLDIDVDDLHEFEAIRREVGRLRALVARGGQR